MVGMDAFNSSDLKTILHSKRANIYYLEHCRLLVNGGRVEFVTEEKNRSHYWNIPIANTTTVMLGTGTSVTQAAMRELAKAGVLVGFCGGGGTPLFTANEVDVEVAWFTPQSEYRPTQYLQQWVAFWFDDARRLAAAKHMQLRRIERLQSAWLNTRWLKDAGFVVDPDALLAGLERAWQKIIQAPDVTALLNEEALLSKLLYRLAAHATDYGDFVRTKRGLGTDPANRFLDHGNYLAYGLAATATWVLGLPHGLAVMHGKTRRGALVFDVADLVKDATILPQAFLSAARGDNAQQFRTACVEALLKTEALDFMIGVLQETAAKMSQAEPAGVPT